MGIGASHLLSVWGSDSPDKAIAGAHLIQDNPRVADCEFSYFNT
jgi:hypothetical protein